MKIFTALLLLLLCASNLFAQKHKKQQKDSFYLFDAKGKSVNNREEAATFLVVINENDTTYITRDYKVNGPMIWQQTFKDANLSIPNGRFAWYDKDGNIDSTGIAINGKKDGLWQYYVPVSEGNSYDIYDSIVKTNYYLLGKKISEEDFYNNEGKMDTVIQRSFFKTGDPITEEEFNEDITGQRKAEYPKGEKGWRNYLRYHLNSKLISLIPEYKMLENNNAPVLLAFTIGRDGNTDDFFILNSCGYPFDKETIRVVKESGKWIPAQLHGHSVTYRQYQRILYSEIDPIF